MTITIAANCVSVLIDSTNLNVLNQSVTLNIKYNCLKEYVVEIPVVSTDHTILPVDLEMEDFLTDGIYGFILTIVQEDGTIVTETACKLMDCVSSCTLLESFKIVGTCSECLIQALAYNALKVAEQCTTCECEMLCTLYSTVYPKDCVTTSTNVTTCGCS